MSGSARSRMPLRPLLSSTTEWRITIPCILIPGWATAHPGSISLCFLNPLVSGLTEFLEAGKKRLAGDTARAASSEEVKELRREFGPHVLAHGPANHLAGE